MELVKIKFADKSDKLENALRELKKEVFKKNLLEIKKRNIKRL